MYIKMYLGGEGYTISDENTKSDEDNRNNLQKSGWKIVIENKDYLVLQNNLIGIKERVRSELNKIGMTLNKDYKILSADDVEKL